MLNTLDFDQNEQNQIFQEHDEFSAEADAGAFDSALARTICAFFMLNYWRSPVSMYDQKHSEVSQS